jgi:hypothetical protein
MWFGWNKKAQVAPEVSNELRDAIEENSKVSREARREFHRVTRQSSDLLKISNEALGYLNNIEKKRNENS